ncbi:MAG: ComF family protein [Flavobacteriales bacterium]|nr:ComF family protein [Flavobacteriales bacterium]
MMLGWLKDFISLIYPHLCASCGKTLYRHENCICSFCKVSFPVTNFHLEKDNQIAKIFWGRAEVYSAAAYCYFKKGDKIQHVMHELKYKGNAQVGVEMGKLYGLDLIQSELFSGVDYLVPVPLHINRQRKRGYNQAEVIADGMAESMGVPVDISTLIRGTANETQTKKSHYERWKNVDSIFQITDLEKFENKHVLVVDDVITTGSTIEACVQSLLAVEGIKVSVVTLACA